MRKGIRKVYGRQWGSFNCICNTVLSKKKKKEDKNKKKNGKPKTEASNENIIKF